MTSKIARILLGLAFVVFATNYFVPFLPSPGAPPPAAGAFLGAFVSSHFLGFVKIIELSAGLLLLGNLFVPLALALLAPILVGITAFLPSSASSTARWPSSYAWRTSVALAMWRAARCR